MDLTGVNNRANNYSASTITENTKEAANQKKLEEAEKKDSAVVFEKSNEEKKDSANKIYNREDIIAKLNTAQQSRIDSMNSLVQKLLGKQAEKFDLATGKNLAETFRQVADKVDQATIDEAKAAIAEDGYWGVEKTSDRLMSMAIALSGGDTEKADEMMSAIEKGYEQATEAWGEELPEICKDTLEATREKMESWKNGLTTAEDYAEYLS